MSIETNMLPLSHATTLIPVAVGVLYVVNRRTAWSLVFSSVHCWLLCSRRSTQRSRRKTQLIRSRESALVSATC